MWRLVTFALKDKCAVCRDTTSILPVYRYCKYWLVNGVLVRIGTALRAERSRVRIPAETSDFFFFFSKLSRPTLRPAQPPIQFVSGCSPGGKTSGSWCWPLTSLWRRGLERVELYFCLRYMPSWRAQGQILVGRLGMRGLESAKWFGSSANKSTATRCRNQELRKRFSINSHEIHYKFSYFLCRVTHSYDTRVIHQSEGRYRSWRGMRWRSWLRHCPTSRKVAGSVPDGVIGIFHWHNLSGRTMALESTQPLTEMSTRNIS